MHNFMHALWSDESGQDTIEYVLLALLIAVVAAATITTLGETVDSGYDDTNTAVDDALDGS